MAFGEGGGGVLGDLKRIPWWGWLGGGVAVFLVANHFLGNTSASTTAATTATDTSGTSTGDIGIPGPVDASSGAATTSPTGTTSTTSTTNSTGQTTQTGTTYVVRSGDTLNAIAARQHVDEPALYAANAPMLDSVAQSHGFSSSDAGHWIFPGEVLKIPA